MKKLMLKVGFIALAGISSAQMNPTDSMALVDLYNATNGPYWTTNTNWLSGPVYSWAGVGTDGYHTNVTGIDLHNNNLSGVLPVSIGDMKNIGTMNLGQNNLRNPIPLSLGSITWLRSLILQYNSFADSLPDTLARMPNLYEIYFNNNQFTYIPDFSQTPTFDVFFKTWVDNNKLTFEYLEPLIAADIFRYSPQDSVLSAIDTLLFPGAAITMYGKVEGTANQYQWTKDGADIPGATDSIYYIDTLSLTDSGYYSCKITNTICPQLTLHRRHIALHVNDTTTGIFNNQAVCDVVVFPNPANDYISISIPAEKGVPCSYEIYDITGRIMNKGRSLALGRIEIEISGYTVGVYFIQLFNESGNIFQAKFIRQ
ncbi:MAG: T9SS type A sorting domain-containing protein [Bacteroidetes bacterium]|nr:T9SS type A sorting domain-containing protein [Bacteroidota bacterium]